MRKRVTVLMLLFTFAWMAMSFTHHQASLDYTDPLPTRPPTATPLPPAGGLIILSVDASSPVPEGLWTVVQWQDARGVWHDVEGWQGTFNENLNAIWWVAPEDLGKGPFRWAVYERQESDEVVAISDSFNLPDHNKSIVEVEVLLS